MCVRVAPCARSALLCWRFKLCVRVCAGVCVMSQLMSYGASTGEVYLSDATLAFLEDTGTWQLLSRRLFHPDPGLSIWLCMAIVLIFSEPPLAGQYIANYSMGGRLADFAHLRDSTGCEQRTTGILDFLFGQSAVVPLSSTSSSVSPSSSSSTGSSTGSSSLSITGASSNGSPSSSPSPLVTSAITRLASSPGALRWGANQGCGFVVDSAENWSSDYRCYTDGTSGCSADHRMVALCIVQNSWS